MTLEQSKDFARWLWREFAWFVVWVWFIGAIMLLVGESCRTLDTTDIGRWHRSGIEVRTDALTGCQYLESQHGMVPRVDGTGQHVGCRK